MGELILYNWKAWRWVGLSYSWEVNCRCEVCYGGLVVVA